MHPARADEAPSYGSARKLTCTHCGYTDTWPERAGPIVYTERGTPRRGTIAIGLPVDPYFHQPLWLQASCSGRTLWAYNPEHLDFLEQYVAADLRERIPNRNSTLASRLPRWMKDRKQRDAVLACMAKLRQTR